jgi:predicted SprT family Zn-dependent metalloprotease
MVVIQQELFPDLFEEQPIERSWDESESPITLQELYQKAEELCQRHWNVSYTGKIEITKTRWRRRLGCFLPVFETIRFSEWMNQKLTREEILDTLLHELVHWRLYKTGQPYLDTDATFVQECLRVGAPISGTKAAQDAARRVLRNR